MFIDMPKKQHKDSISKLNSKHRQVLALLLFSAKSQREIAQELGYSEAHLSRVINSPIFQAELQRLTLCKEQEQRTVYIQRLANRCLEIVDAVLNSGQVDFEQNGRKLGIPASVLMDTVRDILDRAGHKPTDQTKHVEANIDLTQVIVAAWSHDSYDDTEDSDTAWLLAPPPSETEAIRT